MRQLFPLIRQFLLPFNGWPGLCYIGLALLPVTLLTGLFYPRIAFGLAVWDYTMLLAIPFTVAPKMLRTLLCNQRLGMVPSLQRSVVLALLIFTFLQSSFVATFAALYGVYGDAYTHFRNVAQLFVVNSLYIAIMQYAVTTRVAVATVSLFPLISVGAVVYLSRSSARDLVPDALLVAMVLVTIGAWIYAWIYTTGHHHFRQEHESVLGYRYSEFQRPPLAQWLVAGGNGLAAPDATLLLGYPATLMTRLRVTLFMMFMGPLCAAVLIRAAGYGDEWARPPTLIDIFIGCSLLPAAFQAFHGMEWAARLRLIWLRRASLRDELWNFLETQIVINIAVVLVACVLPVSLGLLFSQIRADVLLHYPVLVLLMNAAYSYYSVCARTSQWSALSRVIVIWISTASAGAAISLALKSETNVGLYVLEVLVILAAANLRLLARRKVLMVDWLRVKPGRSPTLST